MAVHRDALYTLLAPQQEDSVWAFATNASWKGAVLIARSQNIPELVRAPL